MPRIFTYDALYYPLLIRSAIRPKGNANLVGNGVVTDYGKWGIKCSMTNNGDPYENAVAERINGILK